MPEFMLNSSMWAPRELQDGSWVPEESIRWSEDWNLQPNFPTQGEGRERLEIELITRGQWFNGTSIKTLNGGIQRASGWWAHLGAGSVAQLQRTRELHAPSPSLSRGSWCLGVVSFIISQKYEPSAFLSSVSSSSKLSNRRWGCGELTASKIRSIGGPDLRLIRNIGGPDLRLLLEVGGSFVMLNP